MVHPNDDNDNNHNGWPRQCARCTICERTSVGLWGRRRRQQVTSSLQGLSGGEKGEELDLNGPPPSVVAAAAVQEGRDEDSESVALSAPPDSPGLAC